MLLHAAAVAAASVTGFGCWASFLVILDKLWAFSL